MKFLVIGNAVEETIVRKETGQTRTHIGGVGAIMARELALSGEDAEVTFLTTATPGQPSRNIARQLSELGIFTNVMNGRPPQIRRAQARIVTQRGNPVSAKGDWPPMPSITPAVTRMARQNDWTIITANLTGQDLQAAAANCNNLAANATSKHHVLKLPRIQPLGAATMNQAEAATLMAHMGLRTARELREALGLQTLMITHGASGRTVHQAGEEPRKYPAPPAPPQTDFIGAGDAATAGLVYALAHGLDTGPTVDRFILKLMERNAEAYENPFRSR